MLLGICHPKTCHFGVGILSWMQPWKRPQKKLPTFPICLKAGHRFPIVKGSSSCLVLEGQKDGTTGDDSRFSSPKMAQRGSDITKLSEHSLATTFTFPQCASSRSSKVFSKCLSLLYVFIVHCRSPWVWPCLWGLISCLWGPPNTCEFNLLLLFVHPLAV